MDMPNTFVQTHVKCKPGNEWVTMKIQGVLVDKLVELNPTLCKGQVVCENGKKIICVVVLKAICGMLQSVLSFCQQFRNDLKGKGCKFNLHVPRVANKMANGKQHTITFHVDDSKHAHVDRSVNDGFAKWLDAKHGDDEIGRSKAIRGKHHDHLGMKLDFSSKGKLKVDM